MGGKSDGGKSALIAQSAANAEKARQALEKVNLPDIEKMKLALEEDRLIGQLQAENAPDTEIKDIQLDPTYAKAQREALSEYDRQSKEGLSLADRIGMDELNQSISNQDKARRDSILSSLAERGALDSGESLAAQLQAAQASTQNAHQAGNELNKQMIQARREALGNKANLAGQLSNQDYDRQSEMAKSMDAINQFRAQNRQNVNQTNLQNRQNISSSNVGLRNTQQQFNKNLNQQQFNNEMAKQGGIANAYSSQAANNLQAAAMATPKQGLGGVIGTLAGAGLGAYAGSQSGQGAQGAAAGANIGGATGSQFSDGGMKYNCGGTKYNDGGVCYSCGGIHYANGGLADLRQMDEAKAPEVFNPYAKYTPGEQLKMNQTMNTQQSPNPYTNPGAAQQAGGTDSLGLENWLKSRKQALSSPQSASPLAPADAPIVDPAAQFQQKQDQNFMNNQLSGIANNLRGNKYKEGGLRIDDMVSMGMTKPNVNAQKELLAIARKDIMPEDSSGGRIIGGSSFSGDKLPDSINSGEMVLNLDQQHNVKQELDDKTAELNGFKKLLTLIGRK